MKQLASIMRDSVLEGLSYGRRRGSRRHEMSESEYSGDDDYYGEDEYEDELVDTQHDDVHSLPTQGPNAAGKALPPMDMNNNNSASDFVDKARFLPSVSVPVEVHHGAAAPAAPSQSVGGSAAPPNVVEAQPDSSLPMIVTRAPTNWYPKAGVFSWGVHTMDHCEWTADNRKALATQFSPLEHMDHLFYAAPMPKHLKEAISHSDTVKSDFCFSRSATDDYLYDASEDLTCGLRPLLEVLSSLKDVPGMDQVRTNLAYSVQSVASAVTKISQGRRELARRFVPFENAKPLYEKKPNHRSLFGEDSVSSAVTQAVAAAKINKDLVVMPRKRKRPFQSFRSSSARYQQSGQRYRPFRQRNSSNKEKFGYGQRRGRGTRRSRGKRTKPSVKSANQE